MEKDLDKELYDKYLRGEKEAFELLYNKYKSKIEYFIYNIIKDYDKAEDLSQETFIYVMKNKIKKDCSFKYFVYLVARSKAFNYINVENRRNEITNTYLSNVEVEKDILEIIEKEETKKEILESILILEEKYKSAIYLTSIEGLSYEETANILGETLSNTKSIIQRGKKKLKKILLKKGFDNMNKVAKIMVIVLCILLVSGVGYAVTQIVKKFTFNNVSINPSYESTIDEHTVNNLWVGTLDLSWKEIEKRLGVDRIQIAGEEIPQIAMNLNASNFTKEMLDDKDYKIEVEEILNGYKTNASLNKELHFLRPFDNFNDWFRDYKDANFGIPFGDGKDNIKYFGINDASDEAMAKNVEVLFYDNQRDQGYKEDAEFAIKLKTQEGDEIILYRTDSNKNFDDYYEDIKIKSEEYTEDSKEFLEDDELQIPYIRINGIISYNELYGKEIANSEGYSIYDVLQTVNFNLNESGCNLSSKATIVDATLGIHAPRYFYFRDTFVLFMKEKDVDYPYFALKVDNDDILEKVDEEIYLGPAIQDIVYESRVREEKDSQFDISKIQAGEYKFYEDEEYEYYYPDHRTDYVMVSFFPYGGLDMTAEKALKEGKITIDTFDKYGIEYIKKKK